MTPAGAVCRLRTQSQQSSQPRAQQLPPRLLSQTLRLRNQPQPRMQPRRMAPVSRVLLLQLQVGLLSLASLSVTPGQTDVTLIRV